MPATTPRANLLEDQIACVFSSRSEVLPLRFVFFELASDIPFRYCPSRVIEAFGS